MSARVGFQSDIGRPIGEIVASVLNRSGRRRSASVVRRGSVLRESLQGFFRAMDRRECASIIKAANEAIMRPAVAAIVAAKSAASGVFGGVLRGDIGGFRLALPDAVFGDAAPEAASRLDIADHGERAYNY